MSMMSGAAEAARDPSVFPTILVLGGARSGKSAHAEALVAELAASATYLATCPPVDTDADAEMAARVGHHKARRGDFWTTIEEPLNLPAAIRRHARPDHPVLVDCLTLWVSNLMMAKLNIEAATAAIVDAISLPPGPIVLVSNEVGLGIVPDNALARVFRDHAGRVNQAVAAAASKVVFIAAGLPMVLKSTSPNGAP